MQNNYHISIFWKQKNFLICIIIILNIYFSKGQKQVW